MTRFLQYSLLPLATVLMLLAYNYLDNSQTERERYEQFLVKEYSQVPDMTQEELEGLPKPTRPDLAAVQNFFYTLDPALGRVPTERLKKAIHQTEKLQPNSLKSSSSIEWEDTPANMGGRTRAVMFDPNDVARKKVWAGGVTGGLWYNDDIINPASVWQPVGDYWASLSISCLTYDPNNTQIFYAGTGEAQTAMTTYRESSGVGVGIFKSEDGGESWELMSSTEDFKYITDIVVRDENGQSVIYAGVASGFYHGQTQQSTPTDGLYRSTDNGASWEQVLPSIEGLDVPYAVSDIALGADGKLYVGSLPNVNGDGGATVLHSTDGTAGSWTVFSDYVSIIENDFNYTIPGRVILATAPSDENIVFALLAAGYINSTNGFNYYHCRYLLKSTNKGAFWEEINYPENQGTSFANLAWHAMTASVNPENPDNIFVGGLDVWNTLSGGANWYHNSDWALMYYGGGADYVHADQHIQVFRPGSRDVMLFGSDGGVFFTMSAETSDPYFEERNNGYNTLQFYTCDISPLPGAEKYVGGLQDNGTLYYTGSPLTINDMVSGGDGAYCFFDDYEPGLMITSVYYNRYYVFNNGNWANYFDEYESGIFINPVDYNSRDNTLYANAAMFNGTWNDHILRVKNVDGTEDGIFLDLNTDSETWFSHVKYSPYSPEGDDHLFVGTNAGRLFKVVNADTEPEATEITGDDFPLGNISCIALGGSEDTLLVTFSNYGVSSIWQTFNGGENWTEKEANLPDMPVRWALYHPQNSQQAMLATELGVWETFNLLDEDTEWVPATDGMANVRVDMLQMREVDLTVLAATHGRGLYTTTYPLNAGVGFEEITSTEQDYQIYPVPAIEQFNIELPSAEREYVISIYSINGQMMREWKISGDKNPALDVSSLEAGNYIVNVNDGNEVHSQKISIR